MKARIFGIQRSGTNYLEVMLNSYSTIKASSGVPERGFWKHSAYPEQQYMPIEDLYFVIVKNPFKWLESLHRYNADLSIRSGVYHQNLFNGPNVRENSRHLIRDRHLQPVAIEGAIRLYNTFYNNWTTFIQQKGVRNIKLVRYEDILQNQSNFLNALRRHFEMKEIPKSSKITIQNVYQSQDFPVERILDYLDMQTFRILDNEQIAYAKELLDTELISKKLGYPLPVI